MKKILLALGTLSLAGALPTAAFAQAAPAPAPQAKSDWTISGNLGLYSDYRFRGISQTNKKPAIQGGFDVAHSSGFYVGNWNSNVDAAFYNGANIEMDFYGGYKTTLGGVGIDVGALYYYYPGSGAGGTYKIDNTELYVAASYGPFSLKYSHAVSDFFGITDSKNAYYVDGSVTYDLGGGFGVVGHVGFQGGLKNGARLTEINGSGPYKSITDWKLGVTYDLMGSGYVLGASYIGTNRDITGGVAAASNRKISGDTVVLSLSKTF